MSAQTITLPNNTTPQRLFDLIIAVSGYGQTQPNCNRLVIRGDDSLGAGFIYEGDNTVSSTNYGVRLGAGDSRTWTGETQLNNISLIDKWLVGSAGSLKFNVEWFRA